MTDIALPKVKLAASESLKNVLAKLGMGIAFGDDADFTGLSPQACCIGFVQHAATLAVDEKGTVASAATAVGMEPTAGARHAQLRPALPADIARLENRRAADAGMGCQSG